jgi:hypothetical protein
MKKTAPFVATVAVVTVAALAACSGTYIRSNWDSGVDFSPFRTFAILDNPEPGISPLIDARVRAAIVTNLTGKGFQQVGTTDQADLAVGFEVATANHTDYQSVHARWGGAGFHHNNNRWTTTGTVRSAQTEYTVGTLVIAVFDMENKDLVWEATGNRMLSQLSDTDQTQQRINKDVDKVMRDFPPGA